MSTRVPTAPVVITAESSVSDIVRLCPTARQIFDRHGLHGCGGANGPTEPLSFFAAVHQVDIDSLIAELNAEIANPGKAYEYKEALEDFIYRRFFKTAIAIVLSIGALWGAVNLLDIAGGLSFGQARLIPAIHAHAHAMIFGWVGLFVMGFAYQSFPRFKNTRLWHPELANLSYFLMLSGIVTRVVAEIAQPGRTALALGGLATVAEVSAIVLFMNVLLHTALSSNQPRNKHEKYIFGALFWFLVQALASGAFFFAKATAGSQDNLLLRIALFDAPLRDMQVLGFAALMIAGVSQRFVPSVYGLADPKRDNRNLIFGLINASLLLDIVCYVSYRLTGATLFAVGLEIAFALMPIWAVLLVRQVGVFGSAGQPDRTFKFVRAAYAWLVFASLMMPFLLLYSRITHQPFAHSYWGAQRHAFTVGFISFMIVGVSSKVVPILAGVDAKKLSNLWGPFAMMMIGCTGRVVLQVLTDFFPDQAYSFIGFTGFLEVAALAWWGAELWRTMNVARFKQTGGEPAPSLLQIVSAK